MGTVTAKPIAEMKHETAQQTNGVLLNSLTILIAFSDGSDTARLAKSVIVDELEQRNADLCAALNAWERDLDTTDTHDEVVLRHARRMKRSSRYHSAVTQEVTR